MARNGSGRAKTAAGIYGQQNKVIHRGLTALAMPYNDNKGFWLQVFGDIAGREVKSMNDLTLGERRRVLDHISRRTPKLYNPAVPKKIAGWKKGDPDCLAGAVKRPLHVGGGKADLVAKVAALLTIRKLPWKYADAIAQKRFGTAVVEWCKYGDLYKIVQMLAVDKARRVKRGEQLRPGKTTKQSRKGGNYGKTQTA